MTRDEKMILTEQETAFKQWNRGNYYNRTLQSENLAWAAWKAAIVNYLQSALAGGEKGDYCLTVSVRWAKKEIKALR